MKDILIFLCPATRTDSLSSGGRYALALARRYGAHLAALIAEIEGDFADLPPEPDIRQVESTTAKPATSSERVARMAELVRSAAKDAGVSHDILEVENKSESLRQRIIYWTKVHDILIVDVRGPIESPRKELIEAALFGSGRPVVLVPPNVREAAENRIVVAWDGTRSAVRAVRDALPLLVKSREVLVVSVIDDKPFSSPHSGPDLCHYLARWHVDAKFGTIRRETVNIGTTLLAYAKQTEADLLVMGAFAHGFERALMLGSATRDVFDARIEIPILLSH